MTVDQRTIQAAVLAGEMSWKEAVTLLTSKKGMPWQTASWKRRRDALIGSSCTQCGSTQPLMVLQHYHHPQKFAHLYLQIQHELVQGYAKEHPVPVVEDINLVERPTCPRCGTTNIKYLKSFGKWCCHPVYGKPHRYFLFEVPDTVMALTPQQKRDLAQKKREVYQAWEEQFLSIYQDEIGKRAVLLSIEQHEHYLSFKDTTTFCKKCAFLWDMKHQRLCAECKQHYHSFGYTRCYSCNNQQRLDADGMLESNTRG